MSNSFPIDMHLVLPRNYISHDKKLQHDIQTLQCYVEQDMLWHVRTVEKGLRGTSLSCYTGHSGTQFQCSTCKRTISRKDSFERHKWLMHKGHVIWGLSIHNGWDIDPLSAENKTVWRCPSGTSHWAWDETQTHQLACFTKYTVEPSGFVVDVYVWPTSLDSAFPHH